MDGRRPVVRPPGEGFWPAVAADLERYRRRLRAALRRNLPHLVAEERVVLATGGRVLRVPVLLPAEERLRFDESGPFVGQGCGRTGRGPLPNTAIGAAGGRVAGSEAASEIREEIETSLEELGSLLLEDFGLGDAGQAPGAEEGTTVRWEILPAGSGGVLDRRRTLLAGLRRRALAGLPSLDGFDPADRRYRRGREEDAPVGRPAVIAIMDTSGSMGPGERFLARAFFFWLVRLLRQRFGRPEVVFIAHQVEAREVSEAEFFRRGPAGGTRCSSAYRLALRIAEERFSPSFRDLYCFHLSDGNNLPSDTEECLDLARKLALRCRRFAYGEISGPDPPAPTLGRHYLLMAEPRPLVFTLKGKADVYPALKLCLAAGSAERGRWGRKDPG